jgi:sugar phosphate isomerase/epimerase
LPIGSPFESVRRAAVSELKRCVEIFSFLGAKWMNVHPDRQPLIIKRPLMIELNLKSLGEVLSIGKDCGVGIMVENLPIHFNSVKQLSPILDPLPKLGLHLDIGHANLQWAEEENTTEEILAAYGSRLAHVHLHDNKGGTADLHLPLGAGNLDLAQHVESLKGVGYDGTITLEVFSTDTGYLAYSRDVLRKLWDARPEEASVRKKLASLAQR